MSFGKEHQEGIALLFALLAAIGIAAAVCAVMASVRNDKRSTDWATNEVALEETCKAGIDIGIGRVWGDYLSSRGNTPGNLASYLDFIDTLAANNDDVNGNGVRDAGEQDGNGDGEFDIAAPAELVPEGNPRLFDSGARLARLTLSRTDDITGATLALQATAQVGQSTRTTLQTVRVSGRRFAGFQFAVLANNINCILCHAEFQSLDVARNNDPDQYGTFDRIRVGSLESLLIRANEAYSNIAGTLYTRGKVYNKDGSLLSAAGIAASTMDSYECSFDNGKIYQNPTTGAMRERDMVNATTDPEGALNKFANLYMDYPTDDVAMTDGELPTSFPAPFPDLNGNRYVDQQEFEQFLETANGSISFDGAGGVAYGIPKGSTYGGTGLPTSSNGALSALTNQGTYEGNLFLVGTQSAPIVIDSTVSVDGDVVLKGPIKGKGKLLVSGNAYIVGDVTYADAPGEFGRAADGTENAFALEAGGSILMGDYLTIRAKNNYKKGSKGKPDYVDPYVWQGEFIRVDTATANATMDNGKTTKVGYFDPGVVDAGVPQGTEGQFSFTTSEIMLFNRMERLKAAPPGDPDYDANYYIPGYTPRYYQLKPEAPIYQYVTSKVTDSNLREHSVNYLSPGVETIPTTALANAAIHVLDPTSGWLSETTLRNIWFADEAARRATGKAPWRFDGLLYTNNCIFGVTRGYGRHKSATYGTMIVRGGMVCADLGLLVIDNDDQDNTGLRLFYDQRVDTFLNVEDTSQVQLTRLAYQYRLPEQQGQP